jgi:hypothetical protein
MSRNASRWRNFWQLHVPLVLVLALCAAATIIEVRRAGDGVWRAWIYMIEWPIIAGLTIWIWHRYRTEGNVSKSPFVQRISQAWKQLVDQAAALREEPETPVDPELAAWQSYQDELRTKQQPGLPPSDMPESR